MRISDWSSDVCSSDLLTKRNRVEIQQDAAAFYPSMIEDMKAARHSIHLQYFIWRADDFTEGLKEILTAKARSGVEVRLLYDALGSFVGLSCAYITIGRASCREWCCP